MMTLERMDKIIERLKPAIIEKLLEADKVIIKGEDVVLKGEFYEKQLRIALKNCDIIDPTNVEEYIAFGGYGALYKALTVMTPEIGRASCRERV